MFTVSLQNAHEPEMIITSDYSQRSSIFAQTKNTKYFPGGLVVNSRTRLPTPGTQVRSLAQGDRPCHGKTACVRQLRKLCAQRLRCTVRRPPRREACALRQRAAEAAATRGSAGSDEDPGPPRFSKLVNFKKFK